MLDGVRFDRHRQLDRPDMDEARRSRFSASTRHRTTAAANALVPAARAKISVRIAPGDDARKAASGSQEAPPSHAPWGAARHLEPGAEGHP